MLDQAIKKAKGKGVWFVPNEHAAILKYVTKIYKKAKQVHNIGGHVFVILDEDETKVKCKVSWDSRGENLTRFCGAK